MECFARRTLCTQQEAHTDHVEIKLTQDTDTIAIATSRRCVSIVRVPYTHPSYDRTLVPENRLLPNTTHRRPHRTCRYHQIYNADAQSHFQQLSISLSTHVLPTPTSASIFRRASRTRRRTRFRHAIRTSRTRRRSRFRRRSRCRQSSL